MNPWTQPTDAFRELCIGTSTNAKIFRANSRKLNNENSFASWGVKWGQEADEKYPSFLKVSGLTYYRLLNERRRRRWRSTLKVPTSDYKHHTKVESSYLTELRITAQHGTAQ